MTRFAFLTPNMTWGGAEWHVITLAKLVDHARAACVGVAVSGWGGVDASMAAELTKYAPLFGDPHKSTYPFSAAHVDTNYQTLADAVRRACRDADVLLTWGSMQVARFVGGLKIPVVAISHSSEKASGPCDGVTHLVGVSEKAYGFFDGVPGTTNLPRLVILNGADGDKVRVTRDRAAQRAEWGFDADDVVILNTGRQSSEKYPEAALLALRHLPERYKAVYYGWDPCRPGSPLPSLAEAAERFCPGRVRFCAPTPTPGDAYAAADVFLLASDRETNSLALLEAFCAGLPCVATEVGAVPELQRDHGPLVVPVPVRAGAGVLAAAVAAAATDHGKVRAARVREIAVAHWTAETMCRNWECYLESLV